MRLIARIKADQQELAIAELCAVTCGKTESIKGDIVELGGQNASWTRLALTRLVDEHIKTVDAANPEQEISAIDWNRNITGDFKTVTHHTKKSPRTLANLIWKKLSNPRANLHNPDTIIDAFDIGQTILLGKRLWTGTERFEERRPHTLPARHPSGMHPRLARAIINLTGVPIDGTLTDPFCGAGGFIIEATRMGIRATGSDLHADQIRRANTNLKQYGVTVSKKDALTLTDPIDYLASDLPYGRNTKTTDTNTLYKSFLTLLGKILKKRAVLVFPHTADHKQLAAETGLRIIATYPVYVHASLTRNIVVFEPE